MTLPTTNMHTPKSQDSTMTYIKPEVIDLGPSVASIENAIPGKTGQPIEFPLPPSGDPTYDLDE
jgi:hypothetical protein